MTLFSVGFPKRKLGSLFLVGCRTQILSCILNYDESSGSFSFHDVIVRQAEFRWADKKEVLVRRDVL